MDGVIAVCSSCKSVSTAMVLAVWPPLVPPIPSQTTAMVQSAITAVA